MDVIGQQHRRMTAAVLPGQDGLHDSEIADLARAVRSRPPVARLIVVFLFLVFKV